MKTNEQILTMGLRDSLKEIMKKEIENYLERLNH